MNKYDTQKGFFENEKFTGKLIARIVQPGAEPRIHGYDVQGDLASHYGFTEQILLALHGDLPDSEVCASFEVLLSFLSPIAITDAPTHAGRLAHYYSAPSSRAMAAGLSVLTEEARTIVETHKALIEHLSDSSVDLDRKYESKSEVDRDAVSRLKNALVKRKGVIYPELEQDLTLTATIFSGLHACGICTHEQLELVFLLARLVPMTIEALAAPRGTLSEYPMRLPDYTYEGD